MLKCLRLAAVLWLAVLTGCSGCKSSAADACPGTCKPHPFCGKDCTTSAQCGEGTACRKPDGGTSGTCGPPCTGCELGCVIIDSFACVSMCRWPECCGASCGSNADCCNGTVCAVAGGSSDRVCVPKGCEQCEHGCEILDRARCGAQCFEPGTQTDGGTDGGIEDDGGEPFDAGGDDGGFEFDAGEELDGGSGDGADAGPACKACCERCNEGDCCDGLACLSLDGGAPSCVPAYCLDCPYGCEVECP